MKIALVRAITPSKFMINSVPPLGLGYLAASLKRNNHHVSIIDCQLHNHTLSSLIEILRSFNPGIIGFTSYSFEVPYVDDAINHIKNIIPGCSIVVGGPHPSCSPYSFFSDYSKADYGIAGEGEVTFSELADMIEKESVEVSGLPGLIYRDENKTVVNSPEWIENLDENPMPDWELLDPLSYPDAPQGVFFRRFPVASIITTRGCGCACTFCAGKLVLGNKVRRRSISNVLDEIEYLIDKFSFREFHILDDNFSSSSSQVINFCNGITERNLDISWCCPNGLRLDTLNLELLKLMKSTGCYSISSGIESGCDNILKSMKKGINTEKIRRQVNMVKEAGLSAIGFFIIGYPGETVETINKTIDFSCSLPLDRASFFNFIPLPGTEASRMVFEANPELKNDYSNLHCAFVSYSDSNLSLEDVKSLQRKAFLKFYLSPGRLIALLLSIKSLRQLKFIMQRALLYLR